MISFANKKAVLTYYKSLQASNSDIKPVIFEGVVYDIQEYIDFHPGGYDRIQPLLGKQIDRAFASANHSRAALRVIQQLPVLGKVEGLDSIEQSIKDPEVNDQWGFDYSKGIFYQMCNTKWTIKDYQHFLDEPKILLNPWRSVTIFDNIVLECLTRGPWWAIPLGILPIAFYLASLSNLETVTEFIFSFSIGALMWTFTEYCLHKYLFHAEHTWLPDHPLAIAIHFFVNGIHHAFPQDALRLVFPLVPAYLIIGLIVTPFWYQIVPTEYFYSFMAGLLVMYVVYECIHFFMHFGRTSSKFLQGFKKAHNQHHYREPDQGFGVSNPIWDKIFNSELTFKNRES